MEQAITTLTLTDDNPKSPYVIYDKLRKLSLENASFQPQTHVLDNEKVAIGSAFQIRLFENAPKLKDLPKCNSNELDRLFDAFINRIQKLKGDDKEKAEGQIQFQGLPILELRKGLLEDGYLYSLLIKLNEGKDQVAPPDVRSLAYIVQFILAQSQEIDIKTGLSSQEDVLLKVANSIHFCPIGKQEGLALYYNNLPLEYKFNGTNMNRPKEDQSLMDFDEFIQGIIENIFSKPVFLQDLIDKKKLSQEVHQICYVKNIIAHLVGFRHQLSFDQHTETLDDRLLKRSREEVLQIFYKHFTPRALIEAVQHHYNDNPTKVYGSFMDILEKEKLTQEVLNKIWDYEVDDDSEDEKIILTNFGALMLLKEAGYLESRQ